MILMPVSLLRDDMIVARDVETNSVGGGFFPLVREGIHLNRSLIAKLKAHHIDEVYVERIGTEDIVAPVVLDSKLKNEALEQIKKIFVGYDKANGSLTPGVLEHTNQLSKKLVENALNNPDTLICLLNLKRHDDYTYTHSLCVALLSIAIGVSMNFNHRSLRDLSNAALLHDIGKVVIPNEVLNKPTKLTADEFQFIQTHPVKGEEIVAKRRSFVSAETLLGIRGHHERYDGNGYPDGLKKGEINRFAKVIAIGDVYDALTSDRSYRKAGKAHEAIEYIMGCANTHFDIEVMDHFLRRVVAYPVGSMVLLSDGRQAVVAQNYPQNIMRPLLHTLGEVGESVLVLDLLNDRACFNITIKDVV